MDRKPTERILADLQAAAMASPEPGQRIAPTGVVVTDANGLSLGGEHSVAYSITTEGVLCV